jgi:catechol 2,3-dioxygenase-like lactoylglutathione lyase family enzyme
VSNQDDETGNVARSSLTSMSTALAASVRGIDHVAIAVPDLEASIAWYTNGLGFALCERRTTTGASTSMVSAVLSAGEAVVVLVQGIEAASQVSRFVDHFGPSVQHVAFRVDDLDVTLKQVERAGGSADTPIMAEPGIRQVFLTREQGSATRIELIERKGGTFSDQSVEKLFRAFESADLY